MPPIDPQRDRLRVAIQKSGRLGDPALDAAVLLELLDALRVAARERLAGFPVLRLPARLLVVVHHHDVVARVRAAGGRAHWVSNEGARVLPDVTATATCAGEGSDFCLGLDGSAVGWTHGHGRRLTWC